MSGPSGPGGGLDAGSLALAWLDHLGDLRDHLGTCATTWGTCATT